MNNETIFYDYKKDQFIDFEDSDSESDYSEVDDTEKDPDYNPETDDAYYSDSDLK